MPPDCGRDRCLLYWPCCLLYWSCCLLYWSCWFQFQKNWACAVTLADWAKARTAATTSQRVRNRIFARISNYGAIQSPPTVLSISPSPASPVACHNVTACFRVPRGDRRCSRRIVPFLAVGVSQPCRAPPGRLQKEMPFGISKPTKTAVSEERLKRGWSPTPAYAGSAQTSKGKQNYTQVEYEDG